MVVSPLCVWEMLLSHSIHKSSRWMTKREVGSKRKCVFALLHSNRCCIHSAEVKTSGLSLAHPGCKDNEIALWLRLKSDGTWEFYSSLFLQLTPQLSGGDLLCSGAGLMIQKMHPGSDAWWSLMWGVRCFNEASTASDAGGVGCSIWRNSAARRGDQTAAGVNL